MKKRILAVGAAAGSLFAVSLLSGCVGAGVSSGVELGTTNINNFGAGSAGQQVAPAPEPLPQTEQIVLLGDRRDLLRLSLLPQGITAEEKGLAGAISTQTAGAVGATDAKVMGAGNTDVRLAIRPKLIEVDRTGDYYRLNCDVNLELCAVNSDRVFGTKRIKLVGVRKLGKENAVAQFDEPAAASAAEWCRAELKRIADNELGVALLVLQLPTPPAGKLRQPDRDALNIKLIGDSLGKLPNLVSYEFVGQDTQKGVCTYRVVYFKSAYPSGIANAVSALVGTAAQHK